MGKDEQDRGNFLKTKSIHAPVSIEDGYRISIMSRHTLNDGITPDPLITSENYDLWMKELAPPDTVIGAYYKRGLSWKEFEVQYLSFLQQKEVQKLVQKLIQLVKSQDITLLCVEDTPEYCHRRLLAEEIQRLEPDLQIIIK